MQPKLFTMLLLILLTAGCKTKKHDTSTTTTKSSEQIIEEKQTFTSSTEQQEEESDYDDGNYCATVRYTNPNTGKRSLYMLSVEVEDGKLVKIHWPNGGWLDDSHFEPPHVGENGFTTFTSDKGYEYDVLIKSTGDCDSDATLFNQYSQNKSIYTESTTNDEDEDEETRLENEYGSVQAVVYKRISGCDYMILEERGDYYVAEWMGGYDPDEDDHIQGDLRHYGTKTCYVRNRERESRLYIEDCRISLSSAWEIIRDKCNLNDDDENDNN